MPAIHAMGDRPLGAAEQPPDERSTMVTATDDDVTVPAAFETTTSYTPDASTVAAARCRDELVCPGIGEPFLRQVYVSEVPEATTERSTSVPLGVSELDQAGCTRIVGATRLLACTISTLCTLPESVETSVTVPVRAAPKFGEIESTSEPDAGCTTTDIQGASVDAVNPQPAPAE